MITSRQTIETEIVRVLAGQPGLSDAELAEAVGTALCVDPAAVAEVIASLRQAKAA